MTAGASNDAGALLDQARRHYQQGQVDAALTCSQQAFEADPANDQVALLLSGLLIRSRHFEQARGVLERALAELPDHSRLQVNQAITVGKLGDHEQAARLSRQVTEREPEIVSAWNALGIALMELERYDEAGKVLREGLKHHPEHPALAMHLAKAASLRGSGGPAMQNYSAINKAGGKLVEQAENLVMRGQFGEADALFGQIIAAQPDNPFARAGLGRLMLRMGRHQEALALLEAAVEMNPDDGTSRHFLALARGEAPERAAGDYVRSLFDRYAEDFDQSLVDGLGYQVPVELGRLLLALDAEPGEVLDLGCGTGLMGEQLADQVAVVDGVDLSGQMLAVARRKSCYRDLVEADLIDFMDQTDRSWDTVVAADVLIYLGRLERLFRLVAERLRPGGWFAFSVEASDGADIEPHLPSGRFRHGRDYLEHSLSQCGFGALQFVDSRIRTEYGEDIPGYLVVARRMPD